MSEKNESMEYNMYLLYDHSYAMTFVLTLIFYMRESATDFPSKKVNSFDSEVYSA